MQLTVSPTDGLVDDVPTIVARGLDPGGTVSVRIEVTDAAGVRWESVNVYLADVRGIVDSATTAPAHGTYPGVDAAGPWWSMTPGDRREAPIAFTASEDRLTWSVDCVPAGRPPGTRHTLVRRWRAAHVSRDDSTLDGVHHVRFSPGASEEPPAVVVLIPGSTGTESVTPAAALLASRCGFTTVVLGWAGAEGRPLSPREVPVERLVRGIRAAAAASRSGTPRVAVVAYSAGTAGALAALALEEVPVRAVVAVAPTHVIWQATDPGGPAPEVSGWSHRGVPLPYVPLRSERLLPEMAAHAVLRHLPGGEGRSEAVHLRPAYAAGLRDQEAVGAAVIPVERIAAPLMVVAGTADEVWPADTMARGLIERHRTSPHAHTGADGDVLLLNRDAGHVVRPPLIPATVDRDTGLVSGGTPSANAAAQQATWTAMTRFLRRHLTRP